MPATGCPGDAVTVTGTTFGAAAGSVSFDGITASLISWNDTSILVGAPGGDHSNVTVATAAGETCSLAGSYFYDDVLPTVDVDPFPLPCDTDGNVLVGATCADVGTGVATCEVSIDGGLTWFPSPHLYIGLPDGFYMAISRVTDNCGNTGSGLVGETFEVDTVAPVVNILSPLEGEIIDNSTVCVFASSDGGEPVTCNIDGLNPIMAPGCWSGVLNGAHTIECTSTDNCGNVSDPASVGITVETVPGWTHYLISDTCGAGIVDSWTTTSARYHSPGESWYSGMEQMCGDLALESPDFDLSSGPNPVLTFWTWYSFDDCFGDPTFEADGGIVEISNNGGITWTQIYPIDGYPYTLDDMCNNPLAFHDAYSHDSNGWEQEIFDLSAYAGQVVRVRFRVGWDCSWCEQHEGWYIDDIFIGECPNTDGDSWTICDGDCNDENPDVFPGSDYDGDLYLGCIDDCDDTNAMINPGMPELCGDCLDNNCNYLIDDGCGGGFFFEVEPNDDIFSANLAEVGSIVSGEVNPMGDYDFYEINVCAGQTISFDCDAEEYGSLLDCWLELYDASGTPLMMNDDACDPDTGWCGLDSYFSYTFATSGIYYIAVTSCCPGGSGGFGYWYDLLIRQEGCSIPDGDGDGVTVCEDDCDDTDDSVFPGAPEICDGKDNDCDEVVDDNCLSVVFSNDFESGAPGWTTELYGGALDNLWHIAGWNFYSPTQSMWCGIEATGNYDTGNQINTAVISPFIFLSASTSASLAFWESYETEPGFDFCMVDISIDGGLTWTPLRGVWGSAPSGSSGGWVNTSIDISAYVGNIVKIRFYFDTGDPIANDMPGWFVDDVTVYAD